MTGIKIQIIMKKQYLAGIILASLLIICLGCSCHKNQEKTSQKHNHNHQHEHEHRKQQHNSHSHHDHSHQQQHAQPDHSHQDSHQNEQHKSHSINTADEYESEVQKRIDQLQLQYSSQTNHQKVVNFFTSCQKQIGEWISFSKNNPLTAIFSECKVLQNADKLLQFYLFLQQFGVDFRKQHIDLIIKLFKKDRTVPEIIKCIVQKRQFQNKYLEETKKFKYIAQFIKTHPNQGKQAFPNHRNFTLIGQKTCHFFKALFQFYYLQVLNPSQTLSTQFIRALTVRSNVFEHEDIAYCISLDTVGKLTDSLQNLDINTIYVKIPDIFEALRFLKLKQKCKNQHNLNLAKNLHKALEGLNMFKIMFNQYEPFVQIAAEKFSQTQIRLLARKFAEIIADKQKYYELSKQQNQL